MAMGGFRSARSLPRRAERLYPLWWGSHIGFAALGLLTGWAVLIFDPRFYLSLLGIRITGALFYFFSPAWWYFGLAVQLYLVFPALWEALRRWGPRRLLLLSCAVGFTAWALGLLFLGTYMDAWLRGSVFLTRLPDFVFGVAIAAWMFEAPEKTDRQLRKGTSLILAAIAYAAATGLSLTGPGMTVAPFLQAAALFVMLHAVLTRVDTARPWLRPWVWVGEHSYSLYLVHHPWILMVLPMGVAVGSQAGLATLLALALTLVSAPALELGVNWTQGILSRWRQKAGWAGLALRLVLVATSAAGLLLAGELAVRWLDPQEVLGWGERPSLEPDLELGWRLNPSQTTHLRWDSYDYQVTSNGLGFPGPAYTQAPKPGTLRVLVTGDAFSSAEGVDTDLAWPRLLEGMLAESLGRPVEVLNLSITGYGPEQYAARGHTLWARVRARSDPCGDLRERLPGRAPKHFRFPAFDRFRPTRSGRLAASAQLASPSTMNTRGRSTSPCARLPGASPERRDTSLAASSHWRRVEPRSKARVCAGRSCNLEGSLNSRTRLGPMSSWSLLQLPFRSAVQRTWRTFLGRLISPTGRATISTSRRG